jgi:hypothetical protein
MAIAATAKAAMQPENRACKWACCIFDLATSPPGVSRSSNWVAMAEESVSDFH